MTLQKYGVWVAKPKAVSAESAEQDPNSPHIHLLYDDGIGGPFAGHTRRASINVKSLSKISELVFWHFPDFKHPLLDKLLPLPMGFHQIPSQPGDIALDLLRANLVDFKEGRLLPHDKPGENNDIVDYVMPELQAAVNRDTVVYLFGEPYSDNGGIHNIHMNQGSVGQFKASNGIWQDGGVIIYYVEEKRYSALFFAFASQAIHTDETHGDALPGSQTLNDLLTGQPGVPPVQPPAQPGVPPVQPAVPIDDSVRVAIVAALVNPIGPENQGNSTVLPEMVYLLNRTAKGIPLAGWSLLNRKDEAQPLSSDIWLAPGECRTVTMGKVTLSNSGGLITLLDEKGFKVDGVQYTQEDAKVEGSLVLFR
jgi:uncharacterized protein YukJ